MKLKFPVKTSQIGGGQMDAQGLGEAGTSLSATVEHDNDGTGSPEWSSGDGKKQRAKKEEQRRLQSFIGRPRKRKEATTKPLARQRDAQMATRATGSKPKIAGHVARAVSTVHRIYRFAIRFQIQITPKFV